MCIPLMYTSEREQELNNMSMYKDIKWWRKDLETLGRRLAAVNGYPKAFRVSDECKGTVVVGYHEQDALDNLVNAGGFDHNLMSDEDYEDCVENDWDDSYTLLGDASEPFWIENLFIEALAI